VARPAERRLDLIVLCRLGVLVAGPEPRQVLERPGSGSVDHGGDAGQRRCLERRGGDHLRDFCVVGRRLRRLFVVDLAPDLLENVVAEPRRNQARDDREGLVEELHVAVSLPPRDQNGAVRLRLWVNNV
jgi:hypothetical protein